MHSGEIYPIKNLPMTIGRGDGCSVRLDDTLVSRTHLRLVAPDSALSVATAIDAGSANGVLVDGASTGSAPVLRGSKILIGETLFIVVVGTSVDHTFYANVLREGGYFDSSVGLPNEKAFWSTVRSLSSAGCPMTIALVQVNDYLEHVEASGLDEGVRILKFLARALASAFPGWRRFALPEARFALLQVGELKDSDGCAARFVEHLRAVREDRRSTEPAVHVSLFLTYAAPTPDASESDIILLCDLGLRRAAASGSDRVVIDDSLRDHTRRPMPSLLTTRAAFGRKATDKDYVFALCLVAQDHAAAAGAAGTRISSLGLILENVMRGLPLDRSTISRYATGTYVVAMAADNIQEVLEAIERIILDFDQAKVEQGFSSEFCVHGRPVPPSDESLGTRIELAVESAIAEHRTAERTADLPRVRLFWCNGAPQGLRRAGLA